MKIQSNSREVSVNNKAKIPGYNKMMWFSRRDITNIVALNNLTENYIVTYDINDQVFVVHREGVGLPNMVFVLHDSGIRYYETTKKYLVFLKTVNKDKEGFS